MDIQNLQAFVAVAEQASFSRAAASLHLTQSAISKRVSALETHLGCQLFDRVGRKVLLTEAGQLLLRRARHILAELEDTRRLLSNLRGEVGGRLSLATSHHISLHRMPPVLRALRTRYPGIELELSFTESELAYQAVLQGDCELAVITLAPDPDPAIESIPLWQDRLRYVIARDRLHEIRPSVGLGGLAHIGAVLPTASTFTRQRAEAHFHRIGLDLRVAITTNNFDTIRMLVRCGYGWSLLPETLIDDEMAVIDPGTDPVTRPLGIIRHRNRTLSNAARVMIALLQEAANGNPDQASISTGSCS